MALHCQTFFSMKSTNDIYNIVESISEPVWNVNRLVECAILWMSIDVCSVRSMISGFWMHWHIMDWTGWESESRGLFPKIVIHIQFNHSTTHKQIYVSRPSATFICEMQRRSCNIYQPFFRFWYYYRYYSAPSPFVGSLNKYVDVWEEKFNLMQPPTVI